MEEYLRHTHVFQKRLGIEPLSMKEARFLLFRLGGPIMQTKFARFVDLSKVPCTFIHGNPHLDNYVRTKHGSAMVDFDRSRMGPYAWDIVRFLGSLSLRRDEGGGFLDPKVVDYFIDGYITHFLHPDIPSKQLKLLKGVEPEKWQQSMREYLRSNKRWAKKMRQYAVNPRNEQARVVLEKFLEARHESHIFNEFYVSELGLTPGSLGKKHFIYALMPKNPDSHKDAILLDVKEVYAEKDSKFFYTPFPHHGQRMIEASKLYADGMEDRLGFCTVNNRQYWGREIPPFAVKVKKFLNKEEQCDFAYSVGSELGKGHRKGLKDNQSADRLEKDFVANFDHYFKVSKLFTFELDLAFQAMMRKIKLYQDYRSW